MTALVKIMSREDELFARLFQVGKTKCPNCLRIKRYVYVLRISSQRIDPTGSFFSGLRVCNAEEFDLNIVFAFPDSDKYVTLDASGSVPAGFARARLDRADLPERLRDRDQEFCDRFLEADRSGRVYLSREKVLAYFYRLLENAQQLLDIGSLNLASV